MCQSVCTGDRVEILEGTFAHMEAEVIGPPDAEGMLTLETLIFGRPVPLRLEPGLVSPLQMDESEWLHCRIPRRMVYWLGRKHSDRKFRLFCRAVHGRDLPEAEREPFVAAAYVPENNGESAHLLRHIIGNPFKPYATPAFWPFAVVALAEAAHQGDDCLAPLHDALLEAGHPELAEHFAQRQWHPNGCWVIDLILGKQ